MDRQLFPSLIIATATQRPSEDGEEAKEPDPYMLGDQFGVVGVSIKAPKADAQVTVTLKENELMAAATWSGELPEEGKDYSIAPQVSYKFDRLRKVTQQVPMGVTFEVEVDGEFAGEKTETLQVRSINDCPFAVSNAEETVEEEDAPAGSTEMGWMFAAYVNENHPMLDKVLQEALETKIVGGFRVTTHEHEETLKQVFAVWSALQKRGIQYSSTTTTPGGSESVKSQYVRFVDQSLTNTQANCVDGSVLLASILRKISIEPFLVTVPGHMYVGFYLGAGKSQFIALETTVIGLPDMAEEKKPGEPPALTPCATNSILRSAPGGTGKRSRKPSRPALKTWPRTKRKSRPKIRVSSGSTSPKRAPMASCRSLTRPRRRQLKYECESGDFRRNETAANGTAQQHGVMAARRSGWRFSLSF